jgi:hypothetical protein
VEDFTRQNIQRRQPPRQKLTDEPTKQKNQAKSKQTKSRQMKKNNLVRPKGGAAFPHVPPAPPEALGGADFIFLVAFQHNYPCNFPHTKYHSIFGIQGTICLLGVSTDVNTVKNSRMEGIFVLQ